MPVNLGESLTVGHARALKDAILEALRGAEPLQLDASALREIDVAGLQLLCATSRFAAAHGKTVGFTETLHPVLTAAATAAGFGPGRGCAPDCLCAGGRR